MKPMPICVSDLEESSRIPHFQFHFPKEVDKWEFRFIVERLAEADIDDLYMTNARGELYNRSGRAFGRGPARVVQSRVR